MFKHADELFECVWSFCGIGTWRVNTLLTDIAEFPLIHSAMEFYHYSLIWQPLVLTTFFPTDTWNSPNNLSFVAISQVSYLFLVTSYLSSWSCVSSITFSLSWEGVCVASSSVSCVCSSKTMSSVKPETI